MPFVASSLGSGSNNTSSTTYAFQIGNNCSPNSLIVLGISYDNSASGGADPYSSISDSLGNTWINRQNSLNDPGTANAGVATRVFTTNQNVGILASTSSITMSFANATVAKSFVLMQISSSLSSEYVEYVSGSSVSSTGTAGTLTSFVSNSNIIIGFVGREQNSTRTPDSNTTNGSWSTAQSIGVGSTTSGNEIISQRKLVTASGDITYAPTFSASADQATVNIIVKLTQVSGGIQFIHWISSNDDY